MKVVIECKGRLSNLLLCWANARHVLSTLGLSDRTIVVRYPIPPETIALPGTSVEPDAALSRLPRVTRSEIARQKSDCLWVWEDAYFNLPSDSVMRTMLHSIELHPEFGGAIPSRGLIGVHARFGDYVKIDRQNPPDPMPPFVRADNTYFDKMMSLALLMSPDEEFFLASDGTDEELKFLTDNFPIVRGKPDPVYDLFALSRCSLLIGSNSTFTSVAATLGDVPFITPAMGEDHALGIIKAALL